jgi:Domain of unknown function (DUF6487)
MDLTCPKCHRHMEEGYVLDRAHAAVAQAVWVAGPPVRSFWTGLKIDRTALKPITTYRCTGCGYLESYTRVYA